jgi:uncharacterized protein YidB (DUF937 family)
MLLTAGAGAVGFAFALGGFLWAGLAACVVGGAGVAHQRQMAAIEAERKSQQTLGGLLHGPGDLEGLGEIKAEAWSEKGLYELLAALKEVSGGETVTSGHKVVGVYQTQPVAPGISLSLAHDTGIWYAQLTLKGLAARRFLAGGPTQWQARGETPQEALQGVVQALNKDRRAALVADYAQRVVEGADTTL